ncbi:unnamed protein product [Schistosoma mattheei]|uniref:Uncharacterized protein n=1 Tax=Schistosoma mattheei TaxID=31246 RepID=A0A183NLD6_9TREM|nr:unnamed protein product [Schistosoma mattheei]
MVWSWSFRRSSERHHQHKLQVEVKCSNLSTRGSTSRCTEQAVNHMWRDSNTSLLPEVHADDAVQKNDESITTKLSSSKNKTPSISSI